MTEISLKTDLSERTKSLLIKFLETLNAVDDTPERQQDFTVASSAFFKRLEHLEKCERFIHEQGKDNGL